jgi:hypothetical protein
MRRRRDKEDYMGDRRRMGRRMGRRRRNEEEKW